MKKLNTLVSTLDQDQLDTLLSTSIVVVIGLLALPFLDSVMYLVFIWPLQAAITYFFFCRQKITQTKNWNIDTRSNKRWKRGHWIAVLSLLCVILGIMFIGMFSPPKWLAVITLFAPLLISRAIIFSHKLPLAALYMKEPYQDACRCTQDPLITDPAYSSLSCNIYNRDHD